MLKVEVPAVFIALHKKDTPLAAKLFAGITVAYALSPIDLIPDFIPVLGLLDDLIILPALITLTVRLIPDDIMQVCREEAKSLWADGKPKKWRYAIPVIFVWALVVFLIIKAFT